MVKKFLYRYRNLELCGIASILKKIKKDRHCAAHLPAQCRFCLFSLGQHDRKGRAFAGGAFYLHLCAGQFQNPLDQRHAKAIALGGVVRVALVEFIVDVFYRLFIHAAAGIGHGNINFALRPRLAQGNAAALRCELHRVGKQVRPHQFQQAGVGLCVGGIL